MALRPVGEPWRVPSWLVAVFAGLFLVALVVLISSWPDPQPAPPPPVVHEVVTSVVGR